MLLRSFSFNKGLTEEELKLFDYLVEHPEYKCDVAYDILMNALDGRIDFSREFNLVAYETVIKRNQILGMYERAKKESSYDVQISDDSDETMKEFIQEPRDDIAEFIDKELYNEALDYILNTTFYRINTKDNIFIHLGGSICSALKGIPEAVKNIKLACQTDSRLKEYIEILLVNGIDDNLKKRLQNIGGS